MEQNPNQLKEEAREYNDKLLIPFKFATNYNAIDFKSIKINIYQYEYRLYKGQNIIQCESDVFKQFMKKVIRKIAQIFGYHITIGKYVFSSKDFSKQYFFYQSFEWRSENIELKLAVKKIKYINIKQLLSAPYQIEIKQKIIRLFHIVNSNKLKKLAISQVIKAGKQNEINDFILKESFKFRVHYLRNYYFLQVKICYRVIKEKNMKQQIQQIQQKQNINEFFTGKSVISNYNGNNKSYPIVAIDFSQNPTSKFQFKDNRQTTYLQFYKNNYKITIQDQTQPLIKVILKKYIDKEPQYGYMVPELTSLSVTKQQYKNNIQFKNMLQKIGRITQEQKIKSEKKIVQKINQNDKYFKLHKNLIVDGFVSKRARICLKNKQISCDQYGNIKHLDSLYEAPEFINACFICSQSNTDDGQIKDIQDILNQLINATKIYGIRLQPYHLKINKSECSEWIQSLRKQYQKKPIPQILVFILRQREQSFYSKIKTFAINQLKCISQVIRTKQFIKNNKKATAASNIIIQMCVKMKYAPWKVIPQHPYFSNKNFIYGALSTSKGKNGEFLSFVGCTNNQFTQFYSTSKKMDDNFIQNSLGIFQQIFTEWIKRYYTKSKMLPDSILIYREGLKQSKAKQHLNECEIKALQNSIRYAKRKTKKQKYCPGYQIVLVDQRSTNRFFYLENSKKAQKQKNPLPGSVITFSSLEENFEMISNYSRNGISYPVKYKGGYGKPNIPSQALIMFTWQQSHNYYNRQGSIRVPACIEYAKRLLNFVSNQMDQKIIESQQTRQKLFYL